MAPAALLYQFTLLSAAVPSQAMGVQCYHTALSSAYYDAAIYVCRVQRMIREAEASTTVEEDSDCDTDSDASTSEAEDSDESEAESQEAAGPKPRGRPSKAVSKATKVAAKEKKPVVRGGRGMTGKHYFPPIQQHLSSTQRRCTMQICQALCYAFRNLPPSSCQCKPLKGSDDLSLSAWPRRES